MPEDTRLIAPCGMNCGVCIAHLRKDRKCPGCRGEDTDKPPTRKNCLIKNCEKKSKSGFCFECREYPCKKLRQLDKRYRTNYAMSMIENLESVKEIGLIAFVERENEQWRCLKCGGVICVHRGYCLNCRPIVN